MNDPTYLPDILRQLLQTPTAPYHEHGVAMVIEKALQGIPQTRSRRDDFGNILVDLPGRKRQGHRWVFGSHMDHPAWVKNPGDGSWEFLGGVPKPWLENPANLSRRKPCGDFAPWHFPTKITKRKAEGTAIDDLAGCAVILAALHEMASDTDRPTVHAVFTRAEEVGFQGAYHLAKNWPFPHSAIFLSVETSKPVNGAEMGKGPIVRVGDRLSTFDPEATGIMAALATESAIPFQRCLLDGGSCEASALQAFGWRTAGVSLPLGHYHNIGPEHQIAAEFIEMADAVNAVKLLAALPGKSNSVSPYANLRKRLAEIRKKHSAHLKQGNKTYGK